MKKTIVFAIDKNYIKPLAVSIVSLLDNNTDSFFNIYIMYHEIENRKLEVLKKIIERYETSLSFIKIDINEITNLKTNYHFTYANYLRLLIPDVIGEDIVLYLDVDIVVTGSLIELYNFYDNNTYVSAVEVPYFNRHDELEMNKKSLYFNSGVMLINCRMWKKDNIKEKVINFIENNKSNVEFVDQCGLNSVIDGKWIPLHPKYNMQTGFLDRRNKNYRSFTSKELKDAINEPTIIHYTGTEKPWQFVCKHPYKKWYWYYLRKTPFWFSFQENINLKTVIKRIVPKILRIKIFNILKKI